MTLAIAGDETAVVPQLKAETALQLPPPQLRDPEGKLLGAGASLSAAAASGTSQTTSHP